MNPKIQDDDWPEFVLELAQDLVKSGTEKVRGADPPGLAMHAMCMATAAIEAINVLAKKLASENFSKSLDEVAYESMGELAERLERLETNLQEVSDDGFRYRGYWRDGMKVKRGEAFTHDGSVWWAICNTEDKPCNESSDWRVAVRKGRDGRDMR